MRLTMVVRTLSLRIQWILCILMCPWLLTYGSGQLKCGDNERKTILLCEGNQHPPDCYTFKCKQTEAKKITRGRVLEFQHCRGKNPSYVYYSHNYILTTDCCQIKAQICYQVDSEKDLTNDDQTSHEQATTMTIPEDMCNSTETVDMVEQTEPTVSEMESDQSTKSVMTTAMKTTNSENRLTTTVYIFSDVVKQTVPSALEMKANKYTGTNIGLYAGLPVGLFLFVAVLAVVCYIFRDKLKIMAGKFRKRHREGLYQESGKTSKSSTGNDISRTFANQEYAMYPEKENKSENTPIGVYDFCKSWSEPEQNGSHHNTIETEANSSCSKYRPGYEELGVGESCNTYDTIGAAADRGHFDPAYNHIQGSNVSVTEMQPGNNGCTEYDNAAIRS